MNPTNKIFNKTARVITCRRQTQESPHAHTPEKRIIQLHAGRVDWCVKFSALQKVGREVQTNDTTPMS